jgi:hypothetical protein
MTVDRDFELEMLLSAGSSAYMLFMTVDRNLEQGRLSAGRLYTSSGPEVSQHLLLILTFET